MLRPIVGTVSARFLGMLGRFWERRCSPQAAQPFRLGPETAAVRAWRRRSSRHRAGNADHHGTRTRRRRPRAHTVTPSVSSARISGRRRRTAWACCVRLPVELERAVRAHSALAQRHAQNHLAGFLLAGGVDALVITGPAVPPWLHQVSIFEWHRPSRHRVMPQRSTRAEVGPRAQLSVPAILNALWLYCTGGQRVQYLNTGHQRSCQRQDLATIRPPEDGLTVATPTPESVVAIRARTDPNSQRSNFRRVARSTTEAVQSFWQWRPADRRGHLPLSTRLPRARYEPSAPQIGSVT
jgi:hypothetical protein